MTWPGKHSNSCKALAVAAFMSAFAISGNVGRGEQPPESAATPSGTAPAPRLSDSSGQILAEDAPLLEDWRSLRIPNTDQNVAVIVAADGRATARPYLTGSVAWDEPGVNDQLILTLSLNGPPLPVELLGRAPGESIPEFPVESMMWTLYEAGKPISTGNEKLKSALSGVITRRIDLSRTGLKGKSLEQICEVLTVECEIDYEGIKTQNPVISETIVRSINLMLKEQLKSITEEFGDKQPVYLSVDSIANNVRNSLAARVLTITGNSDNFKVLGGLEKLVENILDNAILKRFGETAIGDLAKLDDKEFNAPVIFGSGSIRIMFQPNEIRDLVNNEEHYNELQTSFREFEEMAKKQKSEANYEEKMFEYLKTTEQSGKKGSGSASLYQKFTGGLSAEFTNAKTYEELTASAKKEWGSFLSEMASKNEKEETLLKKDHSSFSGAKVFNATQMKPGSLEADQAVYSTELEQTSIVINNSNVKALFTTSSSFKLRPRTTATQLRYEYVREQAKSWTTEQWSKYAHDPLYLDLIDTKALEMLPELVYTSPDGQANVWFGFVHYKGVLDPLKSQAGFDATMQPWLDNYMKTFGTTAMRHDPIGVHAQRDVVLPIDFDPKEPYALSAEPGRPIVGITRTWLEGYSSPGEPGMSVTRQELDRAGFDMTRGWKEGGPVIVNGVTPPITGDVRWKASLTLVVPATSAKQFGPIVAKPVIYRLRRPGK